ncbi:hypothetical protein RGQ29_027643 [Quercus rubra]|uniref:RNase III domain-containing protein n=1 Tax=Quercus rubra TaxID=3512 RepID=A0AAN7EPP9_QUERU|nr:hypothetical protein RGQ29_027643 [Quercus rubra]
MPPTMEAEQEEDQVVDQLQLKELHMDEKQSEPKTEIPVPNLDEVEEILGYKFKNKSLLEEAFTDSSFSGELPSYERLEYVGDAVLNLLFTKEHYTLYPNLSSGPLTRLRAANVDTDKLARVAIRHGLHRYLRHKKPLLGEQGILEYPLHSNGLIDAPKALADIVESSIGAVFIDCSSSLDIVWKVFKSLLEPLIDPSTLCIHPVTQLYEVCQKRNLKIEFVDLWTESTAVEVLIDNQHMGRGVYSLKKDIAHNRAAKNALDNMEKILRDA